MADQARQGLELRKEWGRGGTEVGVARARDISNKADLSMDTVRRMRSYFARHGANYDKDYGGKEPDGGPNAFTIAWKLWGGNAGRTWADSLVEAEQDSDDRNNVVSSQQMEADDMDYRAEPDELDVGDYVTWDSSGGEVYGRIQRIVRDGEINVPDTDFTITGTEDDPAALIMVYREVEDGWSPSGTLVGHKFSTLTKVSVRGYKDDDDKRHIKRIEETETEVIVVFGKSEEYEEEDEVQMEREFRPAQKLEVREAQSGEVRVSGYAAVFGEETNIGGMFTEQIQRGAFKDAIGRDDVVFLINHEGLPLARTRSGTLTLEEDERGLYMEASLDAADPDVRSIVPKMKRGDLDKMSFAFVPTRQSWDDSSEMPKRMIEEAQLYDVSIVTTPAYNGTEIGLRSLEQHRSQSIKSQAARRLRMKAKLKK
jgi:HK97 family phage prohead protease